MTNKEFFRYEVECSEPPLEKMDFTEELEQSGAIHLLFMNKIIKHQKIHERFSWLNRNSTGTEYPIFPVLQICSCSRLWASKLYIFYLLSFRYKKEFGTVPVPNNSSDLPVSVYHAVPLLIL